MRISLSWLDQFVPIADLEPDAIAELLSLHTCEVEGIENPGAELEGVVIGRVDRCEPHPDAEKLSVCTVSCGAHNPSQVVCGAPNVAQGQTVAFAPVGVVLPGGLKLKKAKLRGIESFGMICSSAELGLGEGAEGILVLESDASPGTPLADALALRDSVLVLDNKSLTHRPDLWGHYGFARELAGLLGRKLKPYCSPKWPSEPSATTVVREDEEGCPGYMALRLELTSPPAPSPAWVQDRLRALGLRPISDVVDVSNLVMLECGQPLHAFDADRLKGERIVIRSASPGERLVTLDEVERRLDESDLLIVDEEQPVALAGVMGGASTEVGPTTTQLLLESAVFHPVRIRRTAQRLNLRSDASARFEKSLDPSLAEAALARFCELLGSIRQDLTVLSAPAASGCTSGRTLDLLLDPGRTSSLLGEELTPDDLRAPLEAIGFTVVTEGELLRVTVPSWRATKDVTSPIDLVEEVGRIRGYHNIEPAPLAAPVVAPTLDPVRELARRLSDRLAGAHRAFETQAYTFLDRAWADRLGLEVEEFVVLSNPVSAGLDLLRHDPMPSLLEQALGNQAQAAHYALFEVAKGYRPDSESPTGAVETCWLGALFAGQSADGPFRHAKGTAEDLLRTASVGSSWEASDAPSLPPWAHPGRTVEVTRGHRLGYAGEFHPALLEELGIELPLGFLLLDLGRLVAALEREPSFQEPARFPGIKVDVALAVPASLPFAKVEAALRQAGGKALASLALFDLYEGDSLGEGLKSLAFHAVLQSGEGTLSDRDEKRFLKRAAKAAESLGGSLRS